MTAADLDAALAAATSNRRQCTCRAKETRVDHVTRDDVTEARRATEGEREVLDLLEIGDNGPWVRLSLGDWARVDRVAGALAAARIPVPRASVEDVRA